MSWARKLDVSMLASNTVYAIHEAKEDPTGGEGL
jgi:hypothetical protein